MPQFNFTDDRAHRLFTPLAYAPDDKLFLLSDQNLGFGFDCRPLIANSQSVADRINVLLNADWPTGTLVQFILWASPDIETRLATMRAMRAFQDNPLLRETARARSEFMRAATVTAVEPHSGVKVRETHVIVSVKLPIAAPVPTEEEIERIGELRLTAERALNAIGLAPASLTADSLVRSMQAMVNWGETAAWRDLIVPECDPHKIIRDQFVDLDGAIEVDARGVRVKGKRVKLLSVKRLPDFMHFGAAANYLGDVMSGARGIRENCIVCATVHYPDSESTRTKLEANRQWITQQLYTPLAKFLPAIAERKKGFDTLFESLDNGDKPIQVYMSLVLYADTEAAATALVSDTRSYWRELGFQLLEDKYFCLPFFLNSLPFGADRAAIKSINRYRTMGTKHVASLLPLFGDWQGTGSPVLNLVSRNGQLMNVSLYDSGTNYNCCIAAQSGSGKSFLTNEMIMSYLSVGGRCWVIDVGRSYLNLCHTQQGDFMEFGRQSGICLNPFQLVKDYGDEEDMLVGLIQAMAAPRESLTDYQVAGLKRILKGLWDAKGQDMCIDDIGDALMQEKDRRLRDVGVQLYPFTTQGEYGRYFNGPNTVQFSNPFTVLELEELKGRKHLQKVVLLQLIYQIQQEMYLGERNKPKVVIIDEAWDLLSEGDTAKFMETGYRRFRKYGGAAVVITQSVGDLYNNPSGIAIVENSANMYLLGQKSEAVDALQSAKRLPIGEGGYAMLKTVHTVPGAYSEIFLITELGAGIGRLIVDPFHRLLYSTKAEDVTAIRRLQEQGMNTVEAINHLLEEKDHGRAA